MAIQDWSDYLKQHLFKNHGDFSELPYLSNSPDTMVRSLGEMKGVQWAKKEQSLRAGNAFFSGILRYRKLDEGLWILGTKLQLEQNIITKALYTTDSHAPFYFLSFAVFQYRFSLSAKAGHQAMLTSTTCTFYKSGTDVDTYFYKDTEGMFFNIAFTRDWAEKNVRFAGSFSRKRAEGFLNAGPGFVNWIDCVPDPERLSAECWKNLGAGDVGMVPLQNEAVTILSHFFNKTLADKRVGKASGLRNADYARVAAAETILLQHLSKPFVGIEKLAKAVHVSPTKLKTMFKAVFGFSMLQYHKEKNLLLAMQLIRNTDVQIKTIAAITGFDSASKFSASFKKRFGETPIEKRKSA